VEHFRSQPLSCLTAAASSGSRTALAKAVAALPHQQLTRCCQALLAHPSVTADEQDSSRNSSSTGTAAAAIKKLQSFVHPAGGKQQRADKAAAAAAAGVLQEAVWAAVQAFGRWRLGVLLLHLLAEFTGRRLAGACNSLQTRLACECMRDCCCC
jgi:hypothetical protein